MSSPGEKSLLLFSRHERGRSHDLGKMDLNGLVWAFFTFPTVLLYIVLGAVAGGLAVRYGVLGEPVRAAVVAVATFVVYAMVWYSLHRWLLHASWLYRSPLTARLWKRIHYDHHQDPHRMSVLFGSPITTVPTILLVTIPLGWAIGGEGGAAGAVFAGMVITLVYEFCHCIHHLNYAPRLAWLQRAKALHMAHHFHNEVGNYGIISFWPDRLFGTLYAEPGSRPRSPTVFNLGYDTATAKRYPWVAALSGHAPTRQPDDLA